MKAIQCLFTTIEEFNIHVESVKREETCLVQIFTSTLLPEESVHLARDIQKVLPKAIIMGTTANAVIFQGEQYDSATLIVVEQFNKTQFQTEIIEYQDKDYRQIAEEIGNSWNGRKPKLLRLFVGAFYDYSHQLIETMNELNSEVQIVGGVSGEINGSITNFVG